MEKGCNKLLISENVEIGHGIPYRVNAKTDIPQGYEIEMCYLCEIKPIGLSEIINFKSESIRIKAKFDC